MGFVLGGDDGAAGAGGEPAEARVRVEGGVGLGHEPLLGGLLGDTHALADVGPRRARAAGLIDEVADQMVGEVAEVLGGQHRVGELLELRRCAPS